MLVLSRDCDTVIRIGENIKVKVLSIRKQRVKLGVDAPSNVRVWREEVSPGPPQEDTSSLPVANQSTGQGDFPILVVEDDPDHAQLIHRILLDCHFSQVTIATTGRAAMEALAGISNNGEEAVFPSLVLLDLYLPDMSGLEVLRQIRARDQWQTIPVVMLSSEQQESRVADCLEAGANAFVTKSPHYGQFRESVARIATFWESDCRIPKPRLKSPV